MFYLLLCKECLALALEDEGLLNNRIWSPCSSDSPFKSVWVFANNKSYRKPLKDLAAFCCARWILIQEHIPQWIAFVSIEEAALLKKPCSVESFSLELARFLKAPCFKAISWQVDRRVFDRNGKLLAKAYIESKMLEIEHNKGLLVCEKAATQIAKELLQEIPILQLF